VFFQKLPTLLRESVELLGVALPALIIVQSDLIDDAGADEIL